jgi:hypothetical protein
MIIKLYNDINDIIFNFHLTIFTPFKDLKTSHLCNFFLEIK